jgi:hypothetical protein
MFYSSKKAYNRYVKNISHVLPGTCGFDDSGELYPSRELTHVARTIAGNKILLGFSGKDSLALWLYLREQGFEIIPYTLYVVPGLRADIDALNYYQDFFKTKIYNLPHPFFYEMLNAYQWQPPHKAGMLVNLRLPEFDFALIEQTLANENGLGENYLAAVGCLASDNLGRNSFIKRSGTIGLAHRRYYFGIWDWRQAQVLNIIQRYDAKLSYHYRVWGSTGTGFEYSDLKAMREKMPEDYARVLQWFPLLDLEFMRFDVVSKWQTESR